MPEELLGAVPQLDDLCYSRLAELLYCLSEGDRRMARGRQ